MDEYLPSLPSTSGMKVISYLKLISQVKLEISLFISSNGILCILIYSWSDKKNHRFCMVVLLYLSNWVMVFDKGHDMLKVHFFYKGHDSHLFNWTLFTFFM
jgi:hypothetical protein